MEKAHSRRIGDILNAFFEDNPQMADKLAETRLIDYWNNKMNPAVSRYTVNLFIRKRILYIKLSSSVLKSELILRKENLLKKLNVEAGRDVIDDIVLI